MRRKVLIELTVCSVVLFYVCGDIRGPVIFLMPGLVVNALSWTLWIVMYVRRVLPWFGKVERPEEEVIDEYRRLSYGRPKAKAREAAFDVLAGIQFLLLAVHFLVLFNYRW